jgi:hypothetical protein
MGGKNPDPAATEILKAQAAAKCADQLKVHSTLPKMPMKGILGCFSVMVYLTVWFLNQ